MKAKIIKITLFITLSLLLNSILSAGSNYKMTIEEIEFTNAPGIQASVYIENIDSNLIITSYQCALSINQQIDFSNLSLSYIEGSSELVNEPNLYIGIDNIDGPTELTFVSFIGNDVITKKTRVGTFLLVGNIDINTLPNIDIQWDFDGTICTIITGENFENITNPSYHQSLFGKKEEQPSNVEKLQVFDAVASSTSDTTTSALGTIDGKGYNDGGDKSTRWATNEIPASLTFDLGENKLVSKTRFSFYYFDQGRTYQYNVKVSKDGINWVEVLGNVWSKEEEWSEESFTPTDGRYVELEIIGSINNPGNWSNVWEVEIWGQSTTSTVNEEEEVAGVEIPNEYGISQNYPNPFNPTTKVEVRMKENGNARLDVYNILGEKVMSVVDDFLTAGVHTVDIDGSRLGSGVYVYQLVINNEFSQTKKMNLIK